MEAPAVPDSEEATAARAHLRGVEKHLDSEGLLFNKETVQLLKNAIQAIRDLEKKRKHTIDLLEEETIKNSHLRVKIKGYPEFVMKEFEELVAAARRFRYHKLTEMEESIQEVVQAVESTYTKQEFSETVNVTLCDEQKQLRVKFEEMVHFMNQRMGAKHAVNIETNDLHNQIREDEDEIQRIESNIREVKAQMEREAAEFRIKKATLDAKIADLRRKIADQKLLAAEKREEYAALCAELEALEQEIAAYKESIAISRGVLSEIFKKIRELILVYEDRKAEKEELLKKRAQLKTEEGEVDVGFDEEREELLRKLKEAEERLAALMKINAKLTDDYNLLNTQYQALLAEEEEVRKERDRLAKEYERLSNQITTKLDRIGKRLLETRNLQDELGRLQEVYEATQSSYLRQIGDLEATLQKESDKRQILQEQLADITARYQKMMDDHNEFVNSSKEKTIEKRKLLSELTHENERLKKELQHALDAVNQLTEKLRKREAYYSKRDADLEADIKALEEELNSMSQLLKEKEEQLSVKRPLAEQLQKELEEKRAIFSDQKDTYTALLEEERTLNKSIERSLREIAKLKRMKLTAKSDLQANRELLLEQLGKFMRSLRMVEKDNYELDRVMYILNAENDRLRAGIAFLREDIADLEIEAEHYQSKREKTLKEVKTIYERFDAKWFKDHFLYQMFLNYEYEVMNKLAEDITKYKKRIETVSYVHDGLQYNCKAMQIVFKSKSAVKSHSRNEEIPKTVTWS